MDELTSERVGEEAVKKLGRLRDAVGDRGRARGSRDPEERSSSAAPPEAIGASREGCAGTAPLTDASSSHVQPRARW